MSNAENLFERMFRQRFGRDPTPLEIEAIIDQSVTSYNQTGGITAHTVNLGPQPRRMDETLKAQILSEIPRSKPITVAALLGDGEACQFAEELHTFLKNHGFPVTGERIDLVVPSGTVKGLTFDPDRSEFVVGANIR
jgi:hypothetical protein